MDVTPPEKVAVPLSSIFRRTMPEPPAPPSLAVRDVYPADPDPPPPVLAVAATPA